MYITRKEAIKTIYDIMNSGILSEELENALQDIANCIEHENDGLFLWGADDEVSDLFTARRKDLIPPEWEKHCKSLYDKQKIK